MLFMALINTAECFKSNMIIIYKYIYLLKKKSKFSDNFGIRKLLIWKRSFLEIISKFIDFVLLNCRRENIVLPSASIHNATLRKNSACLHNTFYY